MKHHIELVVDSDGDPIFIRIFHHRGGEVVEGHIRWEGNPTKGLHVVNLSYPTPKAKP